MKTEPLDLEAIKSKWLNECGACDYGVGFYPCTHPSEDYRPTMLNLVREVERLRAEVGRYMESDRHLTSQVGGLHALAAQERARANEAARLSAEARDAADDLRKKIADQSEQIGELERQRLDRDAWAIRVCTENNLYELPLNVEDEFGGIAAAFKVYRTDLDSAAHFGDVAVAGREKALRELSDALKERDAVRAEAEHAQATAERAMGVVYGAREAARRFTASVIASAHLLDSSPWALTIKPRMNSLRVALGMRGPWPKPPPPCCDLHGRHCEPPSELCCWRCTESVHPEHLDGSYCSAPDLSGSGGGDDGH